MQKTPTNKNISLQGGKYARTEQELYKKAITLLDKCKIETQSSGREIPHLEAAT